jgi:hypothetical protein
MTDTKKTFHLAITMAGAISAGAYTAGVLDFLLEALDEWADMKQEAGEFFDKYRIPKRQSWSDFKKSPKFKELEQAGRNLEDFEKKLIRYNSVPDHEIQIEIISGASAGGMTAAIASLVMQLKDKHHVKFLPDATDADTLRELAETKRNNRLYNAWVNLTKDDMLSVLLGDDDIKYIGKPVSALNSKFIRQVAERSLVIDATDSVSISPYVADDFNLFVTLTNLEGYQKSLIVDQSGQRAESNYGEFITYDHGDLILFSFGENQQEGTVHIDFHKEKSVENDQNIKLLGHAAVATGAFPIGLEYASFSRKPEYINKNTLIRHIHSDTQALIDDKTDYLTTFIDGGLINNEPFELTDFLLKERLKKKLKDSQDATLQNNIAKFMADFEQRLEQEYEHGLSKKEAEAKKAEELDRFLDTEVRRQKNYTILMIDPFPSEKKVPIEKKLDPKGNYYPFSLFGALGQLVSVMRTQLLVNSNLFGSARDINDFSCYLIAPRRRGYRKTADGKLKLDANNNPVYIYEKDEKGDLIMDAEGKPVPKIYDGSAAIACGSLGGFGGFLDKSFRSHDFYLGRLNCQSFIRKHFRIKSDGKNSIENSVTEAYSSASNPKFSAKMKEIYQTDCGKDYVPIIPDMSLLKNETLLSTERPIPTPAELYARLEFPTYNMKAFRAAKDKLLGRFQLIIDSLLINNNMSFTARTAIKTAFWWKKNDIFNKAFEIVENQLKKWEQIK